MKKFLSFVSIAIMVLSVFAFQAGSTTAAVDPGATVTMPNGKTYRAYQTYDNSIQVETSYNGGATWALGYNLAGTSFQQGAIITMFKVGTFAYVAVRHTGTGYDYVKGWNSSYSNGEDGAGQPWVPFHNFVNDTTP